MVGNDGSRGETTKKFNEDFIFFLSFASTVIIPRVHNSNPFFPLRTSSMRYLDALDTSVVLSIRNGGPRYGGARDYGRSGGVAGARSPTQGLTPGTAATWN